MQSSAMVHEKGHCGSYKELIIRRNLLYMREFYSNTAHLQYVDHEWKSSCNPDDLAEMLKVMFSRKGTDDLPVLLRMKD